MLQCFCIRKTKLEKKLKSLSNLFWIPYKKISILSPVYDVAKALLCVCRKGSFTVEAALVLPFFLFAALLVLGFFPILQLQIQVNNGLQYAARITAVSCQNEEENDVLLMAEAKILFRNYMKKYGCTELVLSKGVQSISLLQSRISDEDILLAANYRAQMPISFWGIDSLPVEQCVRMKKWNGADSEKTEEEDFVYVTPTGNAYHRTSECSYLKLSVRRVSLRRVFNMRNEDGSIYEPCSCFKGEIEVYITDYGTSYHGNLTCSGLKRTIYKIPKEEVNGHHPCSKCYSE